MPKTLSEDHKQALAAGRRAGHAVRRYLEALQSRRTNTRDVERKLTALDSLGTTGDPDVDAVIRRRRNELQKALRSSQTQAADMERLEAEFVAVAADYGYRKGITYQAWRNLGVPTHVLAAAGIRAKRERRRAPAAA